MLVASNMAPIWRHAQSSRPFCGGADADVQTTEHRKWTPDWLVWTFAVISQKTEQATETLLNQLANIPHPEMAFARWLAVVLRQWEQSRQQPEEEKKSQRISFLQCRKKCIRIVSSSADTTKSWVQSPADGKVRSANLKYIKLVILMSTVSCELSRQSAITQQSCVGLCSCDLSCGCLVGRLHGDFSGWKPWAVS